MSVNKIHKFFNREPENWNILTFLKECNIPLFKQKIESYLTSLEAINNTQKGPRRERAKNLLEQYRQVTNSSVIGINNGSFDVSRKPKKSTRKRRSVCYTESSEEDDSSDLDYTEEPRQKQKKQELRKRSRRKASDDMDEDVVVSFVETSEAPEDTTSHEITPGTSQQSSTPPEISESPTSRENTPCSVIQSTQWTPLHWSK
ncbi:hypothetical protein RhiirA4_456970 [Rhizophagus irregularis]|uniref:Uncharacterized protein n=1 Tax=Rhizophagus irregularis TaxID=588596 RepID=A0A2I1G8W7_9GLOM|nr:hypothetical protein RhiirA4_456970 [Rhizophagus irregularis]